MGCAAGKHNRHSALKNIGPSSTTLVQVAPVKDQRQATSSKTVSQMPTLHEEDKGPKLTSVPSCKDEDDRLKSSSSTLSTDSGICDIDSIITENSDPQLVKIVEQQFQPIDGSDLIIIGHGCPRVLSPPEQARYDEDKIRQRLMQEGLLATPISGAPGGLRFELTSADLGSRKMAFRLPPLTSAASEKPAKNVTREMLDLKLENAEDRRKQYAEKRMRNREDDTSKVAELVIEKFRQVKEKNDRKMVSSAVNRDRQISHLRDRLREHHDRGIEVRLHKILRSAINHDNQPFLPTVT